MPVGTALHERTFRLCESLNYREWSGYYAVSAYETHHEHEYSAIRHAAAIIDISPLFKYSVAGPHATRFVNRIITRDINPVVPGQVIYACWCDEAGKVIDDGTITRLEKNAYRWTAAEPNLRWFRKNAVGMDVTIEDVSEKIAAIAVQGPASGRLLQEVIDADIRNLKYFRATRGMIAGTPVDVSRTGYTGDLGYELWIAWNHAVKVWDAIMNAGRNFNLLPAGILALDVARIEAGLILTDVDYISSKKALVEAQKFSPYEIGLGRLVHLEKESFAGRSALMEEQRTGTKRKLVGLEVDWTEVEAQHEKVGLAPHVQSTASRVHVPVYAGRSQVGKATSTTWSPVLKKMVALASIDSAWASTGVTLQIEITVEAVRQRARAKVVPIPFFSPPRKTATPVA